MKLYTLQTLRTSTADIIKSIQSWIIDKTRTHLYSLKRNSPNSSEQIEAELTSDLEAKQTKNT